MAKLYLSVNAALYVVFALICTFRARGTADALGYALPKPEGVSEYLTVYGGLQWGLALFFAWAAYTGSERAGVMLGLFLYAAIVLYRSVTLAMLRPAGGMIYAVAGLELMLLLGALAIWWLRLR
jgi:hypothetical protein